MHVEIDFETRSIVDLKKHGSYVYFAHTQTDVMLASYSIDDGPIQRWRIGQPCPDDVRAVIESGGEVWAHNAGFERQCINAVLAKRHGWPAVAIEQTRCTAAMAAAMGLPRDLAGLGRALGLDAQKDDEGWRLMMKMCRPRKPRKGEPDGLYWYGWDDPAIVDRLHDYCDKDVLTETAAKRRMVPLSAVEWAVYHATVRQNERGIRIDRASVAAAQELAERAKAVLDREMTLTTGGYVTACSQVARLVEWVQGRGVEMTSAAKAELLDLLGADDLPDDVRRALELRQEAAKASVAKLGAFLDRASADARIRGSFLYHAAGTGRWSSVGAQLHNLPRPRPAFGAAHPRASTLFRAFRTGEPQLLPFLYGDTLGRPLWLVSDAIRGFIWAGPGKELLVADYSSIEGRVNAWLAGERWKIEAFQKNDRKEGPGLYELAASKIYGKDVGAITKDERQVGKVGELALGYQGGVSAFLSMAKGYSLKLDPAFGVLWETAEDDVRDRAAERYEECLSRKEPATQELTREGWLAAELIKVGWRAGHPAIVDSWKMLEQGARDAVQNPGRAFHVLKVAFVVKRNFLWLRLPSGRCLAYGNPQIREIEVPWADKEQPPERREKRRAVTALGVNSVTKKWERFALYGGLICENAVQAIARDCLAVGIMKAESAGYPVIGHVHDEIITEVDRGFGDVNAFERMICDLPAWADGLPLTSSGWRGKRYRKD
jgi:DNA polymerase